MLSLVRLQERATSPEPSACFVSSDQQLFHDAMLVCANLITSRDLHTLLCVSRSLTWLLSGRVGCRSPYLRLKDYVDDRKLNSSLIAGAWAGVSYSAYEAERFEATLFSGARLEIFVCMTQASHLHYFEVTKVYNRSQGEQEEQDTRDSITRSPPGKMILVTLDRFEMEQGFRVCSWGTAPCQDVDPEKI